jgi:predicted amidohydrolase YtcJ
MLMQLFYGWRSAVRFRVFSSDSPARHSRDNMLPLGSDFPVEGVNPLLGFYAAVKRLGVDGTSPHGSSGW